MARVEVDVRVRVNAGEWTSVGAGHIEGYSQPFISGRIAAALRGLATEIETPGGARAAAATEDAEAIVERVRQALDDADWGGPERAEAVEQIRAAFEGRQWP